MRLRTFRPELPALTNDPLMSWDNIDLYLSGLLEYRYGDIADLVPMTLRLPCGPELMNLFRISDLEPADKATLLELIHHDQHVRELLEAEMRDVLEKKHELPPRFWPALIREELRLIREWNELEESVRSAEE